MKSSIKDRIVQFDAEDLPQFLAHGWQIHSNKYLKAKVGYFHRLIMNALSDQVVDHISGDTFDNRKQNLRLTDHSCNIQNQKTKALSGYKVVTKFSDHNREKSYQANICFKGRKIYLGFHVSAEIAATHYDMAAIYLFGEFAAINFPERRSEYTEQLREVEDGIQFSERS